jgi:hypothetical protein
MLLEVDIKFNIEHLFFSSPVEQKWMKKYKKKRRKMKVSADVFVPR